MKESVFPVLEVTCLNNAIYQSTVKECSHALPAEYE
jgi:hypothetical protein